MLPVQTAQIEAEKRTIEFVVIRRRNTVANYAVYHTTFKILVSFWEKIIPQKNQNLVLIVYPRISGILNSKVSSLYFQVKLVLQRSKIFPPPRNQNIIYVDLTLTL